MVKVHRPKFSGKKQLNCLRKVRPVNKGLTNMIDGIEKMSFVWAFSCKSNIGRDIEC